MFEKGKAFIKRNAEGFIYGGLAGAACMLTCYIGVKYGYDWGFRWGFNCRPLVDEFAKREGTAIDKEEFMEAVEKLSKTMLKR